MTQTYPSDALVIKQDAHGMKFTRRFSMAHRLISGCSKKCQTPHGHNEFVTVWIEDKSAWSKDNTLDGSTNMLRNTSFEAAKKKWHRFIDDHLDHAFQLADNDWMIDAISEKEPDMRSRLVITEGDPTTEKLAECLMYKINAFLAEHNANTGTSFVCTRLELEETPTNTTTITLDLQTPLVNLISGAEPWYMRPDMTINDLPIIV